MEISQLYQSLTVLTYTAVVIVALVGIMLFKVLFDFSKLMNNINDTVDVAKEELVPTLKNVNKTVEIVSGIVIKTDEGISKVKEFIANSPLKILTKLSTLSGTVAKGFFGGLFAGLKLFGKKK
jgi:predicted PurR-regulated permease PerM